MACSDVVFFKARPTQRDEGGTDIFKRLEADREWLRLLMARLRESRDGTPDQRRLFDLLCDAVEAHGAAAEQTFYAALLARAEDQRPARQAVEAYDEAARLIGALSDREMAAGSWRAGLARLAEHLEAHFRVEEGATFALARTLLSGEQAARLGDSYERARRQWIETFGRLPGEPQPLPAARPHGLDVAGPDAAPRQYATGWFERLRRPLRAARPPRSAASR